MTAGKPIKIMKAVNMTITGRLIRSVAETEAASASVSSRRRSAEAFAASEARTLAPSVPARPTVAAISRRAGTRRWSPRSVSAFQGVTRVDLRDPQGVAEPVEGPAVTGLRGLGEGGVDASATGQADDDQVEKRSEGVDEFGPALGRLGADGEGRHGEPGGAQDQASRRR